MWMGTIVGGKVKEVICILRIFMKKKIYLIVLTGSYLEVSRASNNFRFEINVKNFFIFSDFPVNTQRERKGKKTKCRFSRDGTKIS